MTQMRNALTVTLAVCLLAVTSCGKKTMDQTQVTEVKSESSTMESSVPERFTTDLPVHDFNGKTMTFYGRIYEDVWSANDICTHETTGDLVNDALFERTTYIEEKYNAVLNAMASNEPHVLEFLKRAISAGDTPFQAIVCDVAALSTLAEEQMLIDLNTVEVLDFTQPWWSQMLNDSISLSNVQYCASGDIFLIDNKATRIFFFNKDMISEFGLESPYDLVFQNKWTVDRYMEMNRQVAGDLNGDNQIKREDDRFGTMAQPNIGLVLMLAAGEHISTKDQNDIPVITCNTGSTMSVMTGISELLSASKTMSLSWDMKIDGITPDNMIYFMRGRCLFLPEVLALIEGMRGCDIDIGILPPPKYREEQEGYYCYADGWCVNALAIPVTNLAPQEIGLIAEAMAIDSVNNLTPAYYEVALTDKYVRDKESVKMLDLILDSVVMENAEVFNWGGIAGAVSDAIYSGKGVASTVEKKMKSAQKSMEKTLENFENYGR